MSTDAPPQATEAAASQQSLPALSLHERRVLGVLIEKAKTTPDAYPLSPNALLTGCNQKNNRDPVMNLASVQVEEAIEQLKQKGMVQQITGSGRVDKFRHVLYDLLKVDKVQLAILGELLLRGPQTEGEIRGRANRMEPIADLDALRPQLQQLAQRGLVVYLTPEGRRGTTLTHGFHAPDELQRLRGRAEPADPADVLVENVVARTRSVGNETELGPRVKALETAVAELWSQVHELQKLVGERQ